MRDAEIRTVLTRRGLLRLGIGVTAAVVVVGAGSAVHLLRGREPAPGRHGLNERELATAIAIVDAYFPPDNPFGVGVAQLDVAGSLDAWISGLLPRERRMFRALLRALEQWPRLSLTSTVTFSQLSLAGRREVIAAFEQSSIAGRRLLAAVLRSMAGMSFFEDPRALAAIGHRFGCGLPILPSTSSDAAGAAP